MTLRALYVDFNSYFASVEQQLRPELRSRPVAVLPVVAETTCCIATSHEARQSGVTTGTSVRDAKRLCPAIHFIEARPRLYIDFHHRLVEAVESCAHVERVLSIDEMYCGLTGRLTKRGQACALARDIKRAIVEKVGTELRCSIGIGPNVFLAKTASDLEKPDGLTVIEIQDLPDRLFGLDLRDLCGIGRKMEKRLHAAGIRSVAQLYAASKTELRSVWGGIGGERMHSSLRGEWIADLPTERSSVGHSHVLPPALRSHRAAHSVLHRLLQKAAMRLRSYDMVAGALQVWVRMSNGANWERQARLDSTQDTLQLIAALDSLWQDYPAASRTRPIATGITLLELDTQLHQSHSLFDDLESRNRLNAAVDRLNMRYGMNTVYFGGAHIALNAAPMRIAFNHIPDLQTEADK